MKPNWIVSTWIFASIKQRPNDFDMTKLRCQRECQMAIAARGCRQQSPGILNSSQGSCHRQIEASTTPKQSIHRIELTVHHRGLDGAVSIRSLIAKEIDE